MGYIKCYVEGYMYLKIRKSENKWNKLIENKFT
jgi:hypothetical protein